MKRIKKMLLCMMFLLSLTMIAPTQVEAAVKINKKTVTLTVGKTLQLKVSGTKSKVTWSSNKKSVATVTKKGKVTAKKKGTATITAKVSKKKYSCKVTVKAPAVKLSEKSKTLTVGQSFNLSLKNTKSSVKWSTSNKKVAAIKKVSKYKYKVTGRKTGTATITAKVGKKKYNCKVSVKDPKLNKTKLSLKVGSSETLILSGTDQKATWKSADSTIASVDSNGTITAKSAGIVKITATVLNKDYVCIVTVEAIPVSEKVTIPANKQVYADNGIVIKTTNMSEDNRYIKIGFYVENNSSLNLGLNAHSYAVNGIMSEDGIYHMDYDVPAGKKANMTLDINKTWLLETGINKIQQLDILIWAYDNAKCYYAFDTGVISIGNGYRQYLSGQSVYSRNGVYVKKSKAKDGRYYFVVGNSGNRYFDFDVENMSINDFAYSKYIYWGNEQVLPSCERLVSFSVDSDFLSLNGITEIRKIEFCLDNIYERDYFNSVQTDIVMLNY